MQAKVLPLILSLILIGCVTVPPTQHETIKAPKVGDLYFVPLNEIVVAVPTSENSKQYLNFHILFTAIINSDVESYEYISKLSAGSSYGVEDIIRRSSAGVSAIVVDEILGYGSIAAIDLAKLKKILSSLFCKFFQGLYSQWFSWFLIKLQSCQVLTS